MRLFLVVTILVTALSACTEPPEQRVLARIQGEKIRAGEFQTELKKEVRYLPSEILAHPEGWPALKKKVLKALIEERILLRTARESGILLHDDEVEKELERLKSGYTENEFTHLLKEKGISPAEWEQKQLDKMLIGRFVETVLEPHRPLEAELKRSYATKQFRQPERSRCRQIVTTSREKAETIFSLLNRGENFAALAQKYSESPDREKGGDLGWVARGELPPIMDGACFRILPGQTSGIVTSAYGFHIFRVLERQSARSLTFAEARPLLEAEWRDRHQEEIMREWLQEKITSLKIEIDEQALRETPLPPL